MVNILKDFGETIDPWFMNLELGKRFKQAGKVLTLSYYKEGFTGWSKPSYVLAVIGVLFQLIIGLGAGITSLGVIATLSGIIGFLCTVTITNGKSINGLLGALSALGYIFIAFKTGNYSDSIMQIVYFLILDIPIMFSLQWGEFKSRKATGKNYALFTVIFVVFLFLLFHLDVFLGSPRPLIDALAAAIGLTGAVLCLYRFSDQYYFWLAQGLMSVTLWGITAASGHPVWVLLFTYVLYLLNDLVAFLFSPWFGKGKNKAVEKLETENN